MIPSQPTGDSFGGVQSTAPYDEGAYPPAPEVSPNLPDGMSNPLAFGAHMPQRSEAQAKANASRAERMAAAEAAYCGEQEVPLQPDKDGRDDAVMPNRCAGIVNADVNFLAGEPVGIEVQDATQAPAAPGLSEPTPAKSRAQDYADHCWGDADEMMTLLAELVQHGAKYGHCFAQILTPADTETPFCKLLPLDPRTVEVVTDEYNHKVVASYIVTFPGSYQGQSAWRRKVFQRQKPDPKAASDTDAGQNSPKGVTWAITDFYKIIGGNTAAIGGDTGWQQDGPSLDWPFPFPPIVDNANLPNASEYWGRPSLTANLIRLNSALQFTHSNAQRLGKLYAHPKLWGKGFRSRDLDMSPGGVFVINSDKGELNALPTPADIAALLSLGGAIMSHMDEESETPGVSLGRMTELPRGTLSGEALRAIQQPRLVKMTHQRRLYGRTLREATRRMLVIGGVIEQTTDVDVILHWASPLPDDDLQQAQAAQLWAGMGVSLDTLQKEAGYDPATERVKKDQENANAVLAASRGLGLPAPEPGEPGQSSEPTPADSQGAEPGAVNPDHPAAVAARQRVQMAFGKSPTG